MSRTQNSYPRLGELIDYQIRAMAVSKRWSMARAVTEVAQRTGYAEATVYRCQQGRLHPSDETLEALAQMGKDEAYLPRDWGEELFTAGRHSEAIHLVNDIWGVKCARSVPNNLPPPLY